MAYFIPHMLTWLKKDKYGQEHGDIRHAQLVGMHTGVAQATCYSLIRARVADPKTGSSVRNS